MGIWQKLKKIGSITSKKHHVEFITALLSIPVLLTVILLNLNQINQKKAADSNTKPNQIIISLPPQGPTSTPIPTKAACKPGLGKTAVTYPEEGDTVSDYPLSVTITYNPGDFCAAVWSYRINAGSWSDYDDKSVALYDVPSGAITFDLRIKSIVDGSTQTITRKFTYNSPKVTTSPTPTITPTPTVTVTPSPAS